MAYCSACGTELPVAATACPKCGQPVSTTTPTPTITGIQENIAGLLCYVLWWVTGLVFFLLDKRPFVRFHALQSIITFGALNVIQWVIAWSGWFGGFFIWGMLNGLLWLLGVVLWIVCMVKAYQGVRFKLPIAGDLAEQLAR